MIDLKDSSKQLRFGRFQGVYLPVNFFATWRNYEKVQLPLSWLEFGWGMWGPSTLSVKQGMFGSKSPHQ